MLEPKGYKEAIAFDGGSFEKVELGAHYCIVRDAYEQKYNKEGNEYSFLVIEYDFDKNDKQADFYTKRFEERLKTDPVAKWSATYRQSVPKGDGTDQDNKSMSFFKGVMTAIEKSNSNYIWNWDPSSLKGKKFVGVMGREEFIAQDGSKKLATKCVSIRSYDKFSEIAIPNIKLLNGQRISEDDYEEMQEEKEAAKSSVNNNVIQDSDLPF